MHDHRCHSVALQHTLHQVPKRPPEVLRPTTQAMLIHKEYVVFEARIEMWLQPKVNYDGIVMAVDVRIDAIETFEDLADSGRESLWKRNTDAGWEHGFIVNIRLDPGHKVFDVFWSGHFGRAFVVFGVLPEVFEPAFC